MVDLALKDGDLAVEDDDFVLLDGNAETAQDIQLNLDSNFGEWEWGPGEGLRWPQILGHKSEDLTAPGAELKRAILAPVEGGALTRFELARNPDNGSILDLGFEVELPEGDTIEAQGSITDEGEVGLLVWVM